MIARLVVTCKLVSVPDSGVTLGTLGSGQLLWGLGSVLLGQDMYSVLRAGTQGPVSDCVRVFEWLGQERKTL